MLFLMFVWVWKGIIVNPCKHKTMIFKPTSLNKTLLIHRPIDMHWWARRDAYGIFTGIYCDDCYNSDDSDKYPYRKDSYAKDLEHGEHIYPEEERY